MSDGNGNTPLPFTINVDLRALASSARDRILAYDYSTFERMREEFTDKEICEGALAFFIAAVVGAQDTMESDDPEVDLKDFGFMLIGFNVLDSIIATADEDGSILQNVEEPQG